MTRRPPSGHHTSILVSATTSSTTLHHYYPLLLSTYYCNHNCPPTHCSPHIHRLRLLRVADVLNYSNLFNEWSSDISNEKDTKYWTGDCIDLECLSKIPTQEFGRIQVKHKEILILFPLSLSDCPFADDEAWYSRASFQQRHRISKKKRKINLVSILVTPSQDQGPALWLVGSSSSCAKERNYNSKCRLCTFVVFWGRFGICEGMLYFILLFQY